MKARNDMECPVCGYDHMDVIVDEGLVKYTCPECEAVMAQEDAEQEAEE